MSNSVYMKHLGIPLPSQRMRYEIDREKRCVHVVLEGFDSYLLTCFCIQIEKQECIRLVDTSISGGKSPNFTLIVKIWGQQFFVDLVRVYAPGEEEGPIAVALQPA